MAGYQYDTGGSETVIELYSSAATFILLFINNTGQELFLVILYKYLHNKINIISIR